MTIRPGAVALLEAIRAGRVADSRALNPYTDPRLAQAWDRARFDALGVSVNPADDPGDEFGETIDEFDLGADVSLDRLNQLRG